MAVLIVCLSQHISHAAAVTFFILQEHLGMGILHAQLRWICCLSSRYVAFRAIRYPFDVASLFPSQFFGTFSTREHLRTIKINALFAQTLCLDPIVYPCLP